MNLKLIFLPTKIILRLNPSVVLMMMNIGNLFDVSVGRRPKAHTGISSCEMHRHEWLILVNWHEEFILAINENSRIITTVTDLIKNSGLQCLIGGIITNFWLEFIAIADGCVVVLTFASEFWWLFRVASEECSQDFLEQFPETIFGWFLLFLFVVDVLVVAVDARKAIIARVNWHLH